MSTPGAALRAAVPAGSSPSAPPVIFQWAPLKATEIRKPLKDSGVFASTKFR